MTLRQQKAFSNIILHCSLTLSITKMQKRVAYWRLIDLASLSMSISVGLDFSDSYFRQTDLRGVDFSNCLSLEGASFHGAKISGAFFPSEIRADEILLSLEHGTRIRYTK